MRDLLVRFIREDEGQDLAEYALLLVFIALVVLIALGPLGSIISTVFANVSSSLATGT
jgi:Flp pilus assembly pilin Flp